MTDGSTCVELCSLAESGGQWLQHACCVQHDKIHWEELTSQLTSLMTQ